MKRTTAILLALVAAIVDALAALSYAGSLPLQGLPTVPTAIGFHLVAIVLCALAIRLFRPSSDNTSKGRATLAMLAAILTAVAPIAGPLAVAVLLAAFTTPKPESSDAGHITIGNPLRHSAGSRKRPRAPLIDSILNSDIQALRQTGPQLHRQLCPAAVNALRSLQVHSDPRTQLHSQGALTALNTEIEHQLERLRRAASSDDTSAAVHRDLASLLHHIATSRLHDAIDSDAMLNEAIGQLHRALSQDFNDLESLHLLAKCQLLQGNLQALPAILDNVQAQPDSEAISASIEIEYHAAEGRWHSASSTAERHSARSSAAQLFWLGHHRQLPSDEFFRVPQP